MILKLVLLGVSLALVASQAIPPYPWNWDIFGNHDDNDGAPESSGERDSDWNDGGRRDDPNALRDRDDGNDFDRDDINRDDFNEDRRKRDNADDEETATTLEGPLYPGDGAGPNKRDIDIYIGEHAPFPPGDARLGDNGDNGDDGDGRAKDVIEGRTDELREKGPVGVEGPPSRRRRQSEPVVATPCPEPAVDDGEEPPIGTEGDGAVGARKKRQDDQQLPDPEPEDGLPEIGDDALEAALGPHEGGDGDRKKRETDSALPAAANTDANPCARKDCPENFDCKVRRVCPRPNQCRPIARCVPDRSGD